MGQSMEYAKISRSLYCTALHLDFWAYAWNVNSGIYFDVLALVWKLVQREANVASVSQWSCAGGIAGVSPRLPTWISLPAALVGAPTMTQPGSMDSHTLFIAGQDQSWELMDKTLLHGLNILVAAESWSAHLLMVHGIGGNTDDIPWYSDMQLLLFSSFADCTCTHSPRRQIE